MDVSLSINKKMLNTALILGSVTVVYNILEGGVSIFFGLSDGALSLLGFGIDSFVEVLSGIGVTHMILRMRYSKVTSRDDIERFTLKITGISFYILTAGLVVGAVLNIIRHVKPDTTMPGIIVSSISIITMYILMNYKLKVGKALNSDAIIADAHCTKTCFNLSIILLISSLLYLFVKISYIDTLGTLGIAWYSFKEGKESMEKSVSNNMSCCCEDD
jgi:divalent metal cation (Fe/Co/Zn/Cd) transporter